jgi:hypothetical protein
MKLKITTTNEIINGHFGKRKLSVVMDRSEDYEGGTPVMVRLYENSKEVDCATWACMMGEGAFENYTITDGELAWLMKQQDKVDSFLETCEHA